MADRRPAPLYRRLALIGALLLVIVAAKLISIGWFSSSAADAYADGQYRISEADYRKLLIVNVVERWKAPNNVGVAQYRQADYARAERSFRDALDIAPERCDVRYNLVIAIEAQADALHGDGQTDAAKDLYDTAIEVIQAGDCPIEPPQSSTTTTAPADTTPGTEPQDSADPQDGPGKKLDEAEQRIDDKRQQRSSSSTTNSSPDTTTQTTTPPSMPSEEQQRQLEERQRQATQERRQEQQRTTQLPDPRRYDEPRW